MKLEFKKYKSRFTTSYIYQYAQNRDSTGGLINFGPCYQTIEAIQNTSFHKDNLKPLIESRTALLSGIYQRDNTPYLEYPITCNFDSSNYNPSYTITIHPGDYLIWDEEIHRFIVLQESIFLTLYREV